MWQLTSVFIQIENFLVLTLTHSAVQLSAKILLASHLKFVKGKYISEKKILFATAYNYTVFAYVGQRRLNYKYHNEK